MKSIIEIKNLTKYYGKSRGVIDISINVMEGEIYGFIGPNGAGKSTAIRTILGLIKPTSGEAYIFGKDCFKETSSILKEVGYMPSEIQFYDTLKVSEVIELSAKLHKKDCKEEAKKLAERFQLDTHKKMCDLSLGNRKKVGIICALQHNPKLCILDEPTSGLDPLMQKEFFKMLLEKNSEGMTIFFSSHVLSEIQNYCKRAAVIKDGKIVKVSEVSALSEGKTKVVTIYGPESLDETKEIVNVKKIEGGIRFIYKGEIKQLLSLVSTMEIKDLTISEPSLEEAFMHFYE